MVDVVVEGTPEGSLSNQLHFKVLGLMVINLTTHDQLVVRDELESDDQKHGNVTVTVPWSIVKVYDSYK